MTTDPTQFRSTSRALPISLLRSREILMQPIRRMLNGIGLTEQKWRILRTLDEFGEVEQSVIAREACLLLPSLTRILRAMEGDGLVVRHMDPTDKRRTLVRISAEGQEILRENLWHANQIHASVEEQLGEEKLKVLLDLLEDVQKIDI